MNELVSLSDLFNQKIFRIPDYQRGYAWKNQQLEDFWDDLYNLNGERIHYTGMLSLKQLKVEDCITWVEEKWILGTYKPYHVVDGQQRLTTFIILLNSIIKLADKLNEEYIMDERVDRIKEKYIVQYNKGGISKAYKFGYETDNPSFKFMRYKVLGEDYAGSVDETFYTLNLENAKNFFDAKIDEVYEKKGFDAVEELFVKLTTKLHFNIHNINDDFDVFVAFETMNNRGKKLSNLEILKNRLIYLTTIYPPEVLSIFDRDQMRRDINDAWREVYYQLGRDKTNPLDDDEYLKNHWTMYFKYSRISGDDYIQFLLNKQFTPKAIYGEHVHFDIPESDDEDYKNQVLNSIIDSDDDRLNPIEIQEYVKSLKQVSQYWYYSFNPEMATIFTSDEKLWVNRLNRVGIAYFRTLVVASFINEGVTEKERIELFKVIERFIFTAFRMAKYQTSWLSNVAYTYARDLLKGNKPITEIIEFFKKNTNENIDNIINSFAININRYFKNYDGFYSWSDLKYVLFEYEAELAKDRNMPRISSWEYFTKTPKDKVSIEHIYPQKPSKWYWRNQFRKYTSEEERHCLTNSLGNLLALSMSVNSSLQSDDFKNKKQNRYGYDKGSYSEGEVANCDDWTPETILERGLHLLEFIEKRWNITFPGYEYKVALLGLTFLLDGRPDVPEVQEIDYSSRDEYFKGDNREIKVSEHLKKKDLYLIEYYFEIFDALKEKIPSLYETATNHYIALRCAESSKILAEIHIQNSMRKICIITKSPLTGGYNVGKKLPDNFLWSLNYRIYLKEKENFEQALNIIYEAYQTRINSSVSDEEIDDEIKRSQIMRTTDMINLLKEYEAKGTIIIINSTNRYLRFVTPTIRDKVGLLGDGTWSKIEDLFVYEINNSFDNARISLFIGPASDENKNKWIDWAKSNQTFKVLKGKKWTPIYRITLFKDDDFDLLDKLTYFIENTIPIIDSEFKKRC